MKSKCEYSRLIILSFLMIPLATISFSIAGAQQSSCNENWICTQWESCNALDENTTRSCYGTNGCENFENKPSEKTSCKEAFPFCYDKKLNQDESDADCGGELCMKCKEEKFCFVNSDCLSDSCVENKCVSYYDGLQNPAPLNENGLKIRAIIFSIIFISIIGLSIKAIMVYHKLLKKDIDGVMSRISNQKSHKKKGLLRKNNIHIREHTSAVKRWMLGGLKREYN